MGKAYGGRPGSIDAVAAEILDILDRPDPKAAVRDAAQAVAQARDAGNGGLRQEYLRQAQQHMRRIDPHKHGRELQQLQGHVLALQGRGGDRRMAHVTQGEVVLPRWALTPDLMGRIAQMARQAGVDPNSFVVGHRQTKVNPRTGQEEFDDLNEDSGYHLGDGPLDDDVMMLAKKYEAIPQEIPPDQQPPPKIIPKELPEDDRRRVWPVPPPPFRPDQVAPNPRNMFPPRIRKA